ncbi:hypothetical protein JCGZ_14420 [Jatropha curcas]|uniref:Glycosyl transferase CAP10 domain-containing protein n=1 Tax=Jatropha curcas TaxID=180498 RepID=A0A067KA12_JATCU|nr:protein O-glucosyltransferase 1 [Jatropha curcas]KDP28649.1 hypothetical protein JCGZ_14420 [Jatropha curcas]
MGNLHSFFHSSSSFLRHSTTTRRWPLNNKDATTNFLVFFIFFFLVVLVFVGCFNTSLLSVFSISTTKKPEFLLRRTPTKLTHNCPKPNSTIQNPLNPERPSSNSCPEYYRWIHEDLRPWREKGITKDIIERAKRTAHFRLVIVEGKAYVEKYRKSIQSRDEFSLWGIMQLLRLYPGRLPDLELMFDCDDRPVVPSEKFQGPNASPPPLFRYCSDDRSLDIVFPDWSFWGWAEINIRPWDHVLKDIRKGNNRTKWKDRVPYAFWKGNPYVDPGRRDLLKCNVSDQNDWNTRLYIQDWVQQSKQGYNESNLQDQCTHRYKIYIEGWAWSVSEKYIIACDSMNLYVKPRYYDFYIREMVPLKHYWPIRDDAKCNSLKFAVDWGNNHTQQAEAIGKAGSSFIHEELKMDYVYDYMFHLLNEYAKLLKFKARIPKGATELRPEKMECLANGTHKKFMVESTVACPSHKNPCKMPPPYDPKALTEFLDRKAKAIRQVETWEDEYFHKFK